jgi:SPP1 gp7 family putative phage head morphogenesis protein
MFQFSNEYLEALILGIYNGVISEYELPANLYHAIANYLKKGLYEGYGIDLNDLQKILKEGIEEEFTIEDLDLLTELRTNVYMFSAAKTFQQVKEMTAALIDDDGTIVPLSDFKEAATEIFDLYNDTWLTTEYNTAVGQATEAVKWQRFENEKQTLPYLRYSAVIDDNTSDICEPLNGIVAPVDDPIWDTIAPLNHFNCRCLLESLPQEEGAASETGDDDKEEIVNGVKDEMQDVFKMNAGKDGYIFKPDHPYFEVSKGDKDFAKDNFGLDIPKHDK